MARYVYNNGKLKQVDKNGNIIGNDSLVSSRLKLPQAKSLNTLNYNSNTGTSNNLINPNATINSKKTNNVLDKTGATLGNLGLLLGKGVVNKGEQALDFLNNMTAKTTSKAFELIGRDDLAQKETDSRRNFIERDLTQELGTATGASQQITNNEQNGSLLTRNNLGGQIVQAVGGQLPTIAVGALTGAGGLNSAMSASKMGALGKIGTTALLNAPTNAMLASSSYGGALQEAYLNGATEAEATKYAIGSTAVEIASEWITGGIPGTGGKGGIDVFADKGIDKISNKLVQDLVRYGYKMVGEGVEEGIAEIMTPILKNATYTSGEKINWQDVLNSAIVGGISAGIIEAPNIVSNVSNDIRQNKNNTKLPTVNDLVKQEQKSNTNYNQVNLPTVNDIAKNSINTNEIINQSLPVKKLNFIESARKYNIDTNNDTIRSINKTLSQRNINSSWDDTVFKSNKQNALWKLNSDGTREIIFNPKAETGDLLQNVAVHELYHDLTTSQNGNAIKNEILEFAKTKEGYQEARLDLEKTYSEIYDKNSVEFQQLVDEEVVASILGNKLGDQHFVSQLTMQKPSLARQIYNWVVDKLNTLNKSIGYKSERLFWEDIKNKFENAYREEFNGSQSNSSDTRYMITGLKGVKNGIKADSDNQWALDSYNKAQKMVERGYSNEEVRQKTWWFQDQNGDWKFEISDENASLIKSIKKDTNYRLGEILQHDALFEMYPKAKKVKVKFKNIDSFVDEKGKVHKKNGRFNKITNAIEINNNLLLKGNETVLNTLIHEVQHYVQKIEKFANGTSINSGEKQYHNNLGEKEARDTSVRRKLTEQQRKKIAPISSTVRQQKKIDEKGYSMYNNDIEVSNSENNQENNQIFQKDIRNNSLYRLNKGLDNSSFSINENSNWQEHLNKNYQSTGKGQTLQDVKLPTRKDVNKINMPSSKKEKIMNPLEISKMTKEDSNTTPILPTIKVSTGDGESKFASNIRNKTDMLSESSKDAILSVDDVKFYEKVTNKESLEKAFERLNKNGKTETLNWINKKSENATDVDVAEGWILLKQYQDKIANTDSLIEKDNATKEMVQVVKKLREMGTKAGQTVQAFNILNRLTPEGMVYYAQSELSEAFEVMSKNKTKDWIDSNRDKFELTPEETQFIMDTMQEVQQMEDGYDKRVKLAEIQKVMTDKLPPAKGAGIKAWMRISMLFNPKTQVRNVVGNAIIAPVNYFSDIFASIVDKQVAKQTGIRTTGNTNFKNYRKGFKTGLHQSYNDFKKGINTRNIQGNRFEISEGKSFNDKTVMGKTLNKVDEFLSFVLDAGDRGFYEASFTNSINNQMILNNTTEVTQDMIDIATNEALSRTWQDNNAYSASVLAIRNILNGKIDFAGIHTEGFRYGLGDILIPFAKTPANLTKAIIDYSPAGLVKTIIDGNNLRKSLSNGQYNVKMQHQFAQELGKATAGTMLYVLGYALAKAGIVSGESDEDKDVANFLKNTLGISSYSIKIGNKSFTYDWAQPIAAPLSIMANVVNSKNKETALLEGVIGSLDTAGSVLLEQSFLQSINDVLNSNDGVVSALMTELLELPSRAIPTLSKQIADMVDGTQRATFEYGKPMKSAYNYTKSKIPFISKTLEPSVDTMGREIQKYGGKNNIFNVLFNPANVNTENISESAKEIYRLYKETGETNIMPQLAPYHINKNNEKVILSSQQRTEYQKVSGKIIEDNIQKLLNTIEYKNMSNITKAEVISEIVNYSYNIAQKEILGTELSDKYQKAYEYSQIGDISDYYSFKASIDDTNKDTKKESISNYLINSNLKNDQIAYLYGGYYSSEKTLNSLLNANVPIKEFIKFNSQEFTTDYYDNGKAIKNSRKNKVIKYINSLNLSIPQKAILIKMEYNSYDNYNSQIVNYINKINYSKFEKASLLKSFGFDNYDKYLVSYINNMNLSKEEKTDMLGELGFTIRNGRVYR